MYRLYLKPGVLLVPGKAILRIGAGPDGFALRDADHYWWKRLLRLQEVGLSPSEYREQFPARLRLELDVHGFLEERPPGKAEVSWRSRTEAYLGRLSRGSSISGGELFERMAQHSVWILGLGGAGSNLAWGLASSGIGNVVGVDYADVDVPDLNRQFYFYSELGHPKAEVLAKRIESGRPWCRFVPIHLEQRLESESDLYSLYKKLGKRPDIIVLTADTPPLRLRTSVNTFCVKEDIPYIFMGMQETELVTGPLVVPHETACFACFMARMERQHPGFFTEIDEGRLKKSLDSYGYPSAIPAFWLADGLILQDIIRFLAYGEHEGLWLYGREWRWRIDGGLPRQIYWRPDRDCSDHCMAVASLMSPWSRALINAFSDVLGILNDPDPKILDIGAGPVAIIARRVNRKMEKVGIRGDVWALEPYFQVSMPPDDLKRITRFQGFLRDLQPTEPFSLLMFNPPAVPSRFLKPDHPRLKLFDAGGQADDALRQVLTEARPFMADKTKLMILWPTFLPPPSAIPEAKRYMIRKIILKRHFREGFRHFVERSPMKAPRAFVEYGQAAQQTNRPLWEALFSRYGLSMSHLSAKTFLLPVIVFGKK